MVTLRQELTFAAHQAFRTIVPELHNRTPITWNTAVYPLICYVPFVFLAYLARRTDTYAVRLLLLPSVITSILVSAYRFTWTRPELNVYNWGQCLFAAVTIAKSLEYSLNKEGMLKVGESRPGVVKGKEKIIPNGNANGNGSVHFTEPSRNPHLAPWFYDAFELIHTLRGLKWKFGQGVYIPTQTRPLERTSFLQATVLSFLKNLLLLDLFESLLKLFPGVGDAPTGGGMFYPSLTQPTRFLVATTVHTLTGSAILSGFNMVYDLITLLAVFVFDSDTTSWPPVMGSPWDSDSMHRFWAKDWHQLLRQTFLVFGGYPGRWLGGDWGMVFGTFLASGLFHECAMYSMGRGIDHAPTLFFAAQGPVLLAERVWRKVTGRRVGGVYGRLWVYFIMLVGAQPMVNAWHRRGLGGGMVIPPMISPTRLFLLPLVKRLFQSS